MAIASLLVLNDDGLVSSYGDSTDIAVHEHDIPLSGRRVLMDGDQIIPSTASQTDDPRRAAAIRSAGR
jgi:hypothetical protein